MHQYRENSGCRILFARQKPSTAIDSKQGTAGLRGKRKAGHSDIIGSTWPTEGLVEHPDFVFLLCSRQRRPLVDAFIRHNVGPASLLLFAPSKSQLLLLATNSS